MEHFSFGNGNKLGSIIGGNDRLIMSLPDCGCIEIIEPSLNSFSVNIETFPVRTGFGVVHQQVIGKTIDVHLSATEGKYHPGMTLQHPLLNASVKELLAALEIKLRQEQL